MAERSLSAIGPALLVAVVLLAAPAPAASPHHALTGYARAHYDRELVAYCGLLNAEVAAGFRLVRDAARAAEGLGEAAARQARIDAGVAFDYEWNNRNMAGARAWCLEEGGAAALSFFRRYIEDRFSRRTLTK